MFTKGGQPEILRAAQRDETFQKKLNENISEILQSLCGIHFWIKYKERAKILLNILYDVMTTMSNLQTLGEEYTGMVQVNSSASSLPKKYLQFLMILLKNCGEKTLADALVKFRKTIENLPKDHPLQQSARNELIKMSHALQASLPFLTKFHKAIFYFNGDYYEIGKRLCGIRYILVRFWLKNTSSLPAFKLLGIVSLLHVALYSIFGVLNYKNLVIEREETSKTVTECTEPSDKCSLCLNARQHTSVTPCGHLFCWDCIISWLQEQPKCPLCRQVFQPSRIVYLQNYEYTS